MLTTARLVVVQVTTGQDVPTVQSSKLLKFSFVYLLICISREPHEIKIIITLIFQHIFLEENILR